MTDGLVLRVVKAGGIIYLSLIGYSIQNARLGVDIIYLYLAIALCII